MDNDAISNTYPSSNYFIAGGDNYLTSTVTNIYDANTPANYNSTSVTYTYGNIKHQQVTKTTHVDSKGNTIYSFSKYPSDYLSGSATLTGYSLIDSMINRNMLAEVTETRDSVKNVSTGVNGITKAQLNWFTRALASMGAVMPGFIRIMPISTPITDFVNSYIDPTTHQPVFDARYASMIGFNAYDDKNNIQTYTTRSSPPVSIMWNYNYDLPVAQIKNANSDYAYTSFEADSKGGWSYSGNGGADGTAPSGSKVYSLTSSGPITSPALSSGKSYILTIWAKNPNAPTVTWAAASQTATKLRTVGSWNLFMYRLAAGATSVVISGGGSVDEVRLYPSDAQMNTFTYNPNGVMQMIDSKGQVVKYEYDDFERLLNIKDWEGNIVKNFGYHYYNQ